MRRRRVVTTVAAGLALVLGGALAGLAHAGRAVDVEPGTALPFEIEDGVRLALADAVLAPSSHNAQMWRAAVDPQGRRITVGVDPERQLPVIDPEARESYLSLGAFTENLRRSLVARGYETRVEVRSRADGAVAEVRYGPGGGSVDEEETDLIAARHSDKREFEDTVLPARVVGDLEAVAPGAVTHLGAGSREANRLAEEIVAATDAQNASQPVRDELAAWLRLSDDEARREKDGLPAEQLGLTGIPKALYYLTSDGESVRGDAFARQGLDRTRGQVEHGAGFLVLTGGPEPVELIQAGMDLEALWLEATRHGISVHPMSQSLEQEPWASRAAETVGVDGPVQMILRVGYVPDYGRNAGIRRDLADVVVLDRDGAP